MDADEPTGIQLYPGGFHVVLTYSVCGSSPPRRGKEVNPMGGFVTFIESVAAQVIAYLICEWLGDVLSNKNCKH